MCQNLPSVWGGNLLFSADALLALRGAEVLEAMAVMFGMRTPIQPVDQFEEVQ